jgi:curli biogenesis system outer membrane secretion channel CsgG
VVMSSRPGRVVAILDFDYATVHGGVSSIFGQDVDIGKGIADLMVTNLVKDGSYSVIERKATVAEA